MMRTDLEIVQVPAPPFSGLKGKNKVAIDPDFKTELLRVSDGGDTANQLSVMTSASGNAGLWNSNDTLLLARTQGPLLLYQFYPGRFQAQLLPFTLKRADAVFSNVYPGVLYVLEGLAVRKITFQRVNGVYAYLKSDPVCDFAQVLPASFQLKWTGTFGISESDAVISIAFSEGVQNTAIYACVWKRGKGFRLLNTSTGTVTGSWGECGQIRLSSPDTKVPFSMHEFAQTPNPEFAQIGAFKGGSSPLVWQISTLDVRDSVITGHGAKGFLHRYAGGPGGGQIKEVLYSDPSQTRLVVPKENLPASKGQKYDGDSHYGFGLVAPDDKSVFWASGQTNQSPFTSAWMNEIRGYDVSSGKVYRAGHTFNSGLSPEFIPANAIAVPSPTGKYVAFCSDMMQGLGQTASGVPRGDIFIVELDWS